MALGTTNINLEVVREYVGEDTHNLGTLCRSASVNIWSRYKPVIGNWPAATTGDYGLNLATPVGSLVSSYPTGEWERSLPNNTYRLGDFAGFDASANPFCYVSQAQTADVNLIASDAATFMINVNGNYIGINSSDYSTYAFDTYFPGIRLNYGAGYTSYAYLTIETSVGAGFNTEIVFGLDTAPFTGWQGVYYWDAFLVDACISTAVINPGEPEYDQPCVKCPSSYIWGVGSRLNRGSFTVTEVATVSIVDVSVYTENGGGDWYDPDEDPGTITVSDSRARWYIQIASTTGSNVSLSDMWFSMTPALDTGDVPTSFQLTTNQESATVATPAGVTLSFLAINTWANTGGVMSGPLGPTQITFRIRQNGTSGLSVWTGALTAQVLA